MSLRIAAAFLAAVLASAGASARPEAQPAHPGQAVFDRACAVCHLHPESVRAPALSTLHAMPADQLRFALTEGVMRQQGAGLSAEEREQVIAFLAPAAKPGDAAAASLAWVEPLRCPADRAAVDLSAPRTVTGAGVEPANTRRLSARAARLNAADMGRLEVAWTLAFPQTTSLRVTPLVVGSTLFYVAPQLGTALALDTRTGCVKWARRLARQLRGTPALGDLPGGVARLFVADAQGTVHALDPRDGREVWAVDPRPDKTTPITGGLVFHRDRVIVPISASDVGRSGDPKYACCSSHGALAAVDASTGTVLWTAHTMEAAKPNGRTSTAGVPLMGPSGAPIWSTPTVDAARGLVYVGVGENTSLPATDTSDSILTLDFETGARRWAFQPTPRDVWNTACHKAGHPNCDFSDAESIKKDWDFGASPILLKTAGGRDMLLAGQKSGHVYGFDPGGRLLWTQRFGGGTSLGGVHWALATDGRRVFAPINDPVIDTGPSEAPGLNALDARTGKVLWRYAAKPDCGGGRAERVLSCTTRYGFSAAPLVVGSAVVAAQLDGWLRVFDGASGRQLFAFDTAREFSSATGVKARGGAIDAQSIGAGDGHLFVGSGYGAFSEQPGNVLIAFRPRPAGLRRTQPPAAALATLVGAAPLACARSLARAPASMFCRA